MRVTLYILGDSGSEYDITVTQINGKTSVHCSCPAGELNQLCKHKIDILSGNTNRLAPGANGGDSPTWARARQMIETSGIPAALARYQADIKANDLAQAKLKKEAKGIKGQFARELAAGL